MEKLAVFYNQNQTVRNNNSFSPSAGKPEHVTNMYRRNPRVEVISSFKPLAREHFYVAHDSDHVDDVLSCQRMNGFGSKSQAVADSLPWTAGSFLWAAVHAIRNNTVAMSPTSGFHHAGYANCTGFCTFNGLMIAAQHLRGQLVDRVGIIDFDAHYGDGTDDIIDRLKLNYIEHLTFGKFARSGANFDMWLDNLQSNLTKRFSDCDVLFYQAGADPHIDDPLGGYLTTEQMKRRDDIVFMVAKDLDLPIVWNLAGGYQEPFQKVLDIHQNTLDACLDNYLTP